MVPTVGVLLSRCGPGLLRMSLERPCIDAKPTTQQLGVHAAEVRSSESQSAASEKTCYVQARFNMRPTVTRDECRKLTLRVGFETSVLCGVTLETESRCL